MKSTRFIDQSPSYSPVNIPYLLSKGWKETKSRATSRGLKAQIWSDSEQTKHCE